MVDLSSLGQAILVTPPVLEPITIAELKMHLRLDSETMAGDIATYQSILPNSYGIYELMTLDVAPGGAGWAAGDTITGATSHNTCVIVTKLTGTTYYVNNRSGAFTLGEIMSNGTAAADQGAAHPTFAVGYYLIGTGVDVLGKTALVNLDTGSVGTLDAKIQESDDNVTYTDVTGGGFTQVTVANDNAIQEKAYTGTKQYIRVVAKVSVASCEFGASVIVNAATTADESLLTDLIKEAREYAEYLTQRALLTQTWDYFIETWPATDYIRLPYGNLQDGLGVAPVVTWKDETGAVTTLTVTTDYIVETNGKQCGRIVLPYGVSWPTGTLYPSKPIQVRFICGWTAANLIPGKIKAAVKMICAKLYEGRGEDVIGQTVTEDKVVERLLTAERLWENAV